MAQTERDTFYESYATTHAGAPSDAAKPHGRINPVFGRDVLRHLPEDRTGAIIDLGCGQGALVAAMQAVGYVNAGGVDVSPEQVKFAAERGVPNIEQGDVLQTLSSSPGSFSAVTATDFFEHLTRAELLDLMPRIRTALRPGGVLVARVPNAVSPFGGNYRHGDFTHESWFTARSVRQLMAVTGFSTVESFPTEPVAHGAVSAVRWAIWRLYSGFFKLGLAAETGVLRGNIVTQNLVFVARR